MTVMSYLLVALLSLVPINTGSWFTSDQNGGGSVRLSATANGIQFVFPQNGTGKKHGKRSRQATINYLETYYPAPIVGHSIVFTFRIQTSSPFVVFNYDFGGNSCAYSAHVRVHIARVGWSTIRSYPPGDDYRWFSNPIAAELVGGSEIQLTVPLAPDQWSNVYGHFGNEDATHAAGFQDTLQHPERVGLAFGGGCFFGHGVNVSGGTAIFELQRLEIQ